MSYNLKELKAAANKACGLAYEQRQQIPGAVNWADLHCISAERYEDDEGNTGLRVVIEEADPGAFEFGQFIRQRLAVVGYPFVEVVTEW